MNKVGDKSVPILVEYYYQSSIYGLELFYTTISYRVPLVDTFLGNYPERILNQLIVDVYKLPYNAHGSTNKTQEMQLM